MVKWGHSSLAKVFMLTKTLRSLVFHPILIAIYPVLAMMAMNMDQVLPRTALRVGLVCLVSGLGLYLLAFAALRNAGKAALLASFWLVLFFTYGHVYQLVEGRAALGVVYGKHRVLAAVWLGMAALGGWWIIRKLQSTGSLNQVFNWVSIFLLVFPLFQIGAFQVRSMQAPAGPQVVSGAQAAQNQSGPDIYYIVLDGYSRADVIQKLYDLDITPFMDELKSMGFVFPECAQSNYSITALSMFASLNMNYLEAYGDAIPIGSEREKIDFQAMHEYLSHSQVRQYLQKQGYQMVTFDTGYWWLTVDDADLYIVENNNPLKKYSDRYTLSNFEEMFLRTTALRVLSEVNAAYFAPLTRHVKSSTEQHYEWVKFALDELDQIPAIPGKKFVYFHVLAPHDPQVFAPDGSYLHSDNTHSDIPGYPNEVTYLNQRIVEIVRIIGNVVRNRGNMRLGARERPIFEVPIVTLLGEGAR